MAYHTNPNSRDWSIRQALRAKRLIYKWPTKKKEKKKENWMFYNITNGNKTNGTFSPIIQLQMVTYGQIGRHFCTQRYAESSRLNANFFIETFPWKGLGYEFHFLKLWHSVYIPWNNNFDLLFLGNVFYCRSRRWLRIRVAQGEVQERKFRLIHGLKI